MAIIIDNDLDGSPVVYHKRKPKKASSSSPSKKKKVGARAVRGYPSSGYPERTAPKKPPGSPDLIRGYQAQLSGKAKKRIRGQLDPDRIAAIRERNEEVVQSARASRNQGYERRYGPEPQLPRQRRWSGGGSGSGSGTGGGGGGGGFGGGYVHDDERERLIRSRNDASMTRANGSQHPGMIYDSTKGGWIPYLSPYGAENPGFVRYGEPSNRFAGGDTIGGSGGGGGGFGGSGEIIIPMEIPQYSESPWAGRNPQAAIYSAPYTAPQPSFARNNADIYPWGSEQNMQHPMGLNNELWYGTDGMMPRGDEEGLAMRLWRLLSDSNLFR